MAHPLSGIERRARIKGVPFALTTAEHDAILFDACVYCGCARWPRVLDRKEPALGYVITNVVSACSECNNAKSDMFSYQEMLVIGIAIAQVKATWPGSKRRPVRKIHKRAASRLGIPPLVFPENGYDF